ncbi:MAG: hypothetical protein LQ337_006612 [Flavoplaca oasis]|nr:MAG: hypothetical protein LQ337_006612 [Flavoplaca oasis]
MEDYHQYYLVALGQNPNVNGPWFAGVCEGLRKLGPIQSVTIRNTWDKIYDDDLEARSVSSEAEMDTSGEAYHDTSDGDEDSKNEDENDQWEDCNGSDTDTYSPLADTPGLRMDGTRLVGSPSARAWRPTWLNPSYRMKHFDDRENACSVYWEEWQNVQYDFTLVVHMLENARIQPEAFRVPGNKDESQSLSPRLLKCLDAQRTFDEPFLYLAGHLQELHLSIASYDQYPAQRLVPDLSLLRVFLKRAKSLVSLSIILSTANNFVSEEIILYKSSNVFPTLVELELHGLRALSIVGLRISYSDLIGLLFLKLPNLESLRLSSIALVGGKWENVVEGLRQRKHMKKCVLKSPLSYEDLYDIYPPGLFNNALEDQVLSVNSNYIVYGGRHPSLQRDEVDSASLKYLESLDQELNKIHKAFGQQA